MQDITVNGREFAVEFEYASQGHRITVMEFDGDDWQTLPNYNGTLCIGTTYFETLCNLSSDLFEEAVYGEDFALALKVPMIGSDDAECVKCGTWQHYSEMVQASEELNLTKFDYLCEDCHYELTATPNQGEK